MFAPCFWENPLFLSKLNWWPLHFARLLNRRLEHAHYLPPFFDLDFLSLTQPRFELGKFIPKLSDDHRFHVDKICPHYQNLKPILDPRGIPCHIAPGMYISIVLRVKLRAATIGRHELACGV